MRKHHSTAVSLLLTKMAKIDISQLALDGMYQPLKQHE